MKDGFVAIGGSAGDFLGGALPGEMRGMSGGVVTVAGSTGERAGDRMRRGTILVGGNAGAYAGSRMIAGTLVVLGEQAGAYPGFIMRRGTLLLRAAPQRLLPTFADAGTHELGFLRLLRRSLAGTGTGAATLDQLGLRVRRFIGDAAVAGKGEILVWQP
jgi:formylmethanofuran dehydrogenase subunit C